MDKHNAGRKQPAPQPKPKPTPRANPSIVSPIQKGDKPNVTRPTEPDIIRKHF